MRINNIILILSILIILFGILIYKNFYYKEQFGTPHYKGCCGYQPFYSEKQDETKGDECSHGEYVNSIPDFHSNRFEYARNFPKSLKIHYVNPRHPCCLRTCINDFTYTPENTKDSLSDKSKIGKFKEYIPLDLLGSSQCDQCINNFSSAINLMANPDPCEGKE
jgi:hypothetical protein